MNGHTNADMINRMAQGAIQCPRCGKLNRPGSNFCLTCGMRLMPPQQAAPQMQPQSADSEAPAIPKFCPYCGTATNGMKFCGNCGKQLA